MQRMIITFISLFLLVTTCNASSSKLVSYEYIGILDRATATQAVKNIPPLNSLEMKYDLRLYKIHYYTLTPNMKLTIASGLVALPIEHVMPVGIVNYYHGTRINRDDVPTQHAERYYPYLATFGNSGGYMVVMPDYLGLGDNDLLLHPYVDATTLANSGIDMFIASKEFTQRMNYTINDEVFLTGYSEGGFTTIATYDAILKYHPEINITAVAPGSAPYDWSETMRFIILNSGPRSSAYLAYFFYSMQTYYHYWSNLSVIFQKPYDTLVPALYDGHHVNDDILQALPQNPRDLLQPEFLRNITEGLDPHTKDLEINMNHYYFTAKSPLLLVGTKGDADVPYHSAEIAYSELSKKSNQVFIKSVSDTLDHIQANPYVTKEQLLFFQGFSNQYSSQD